MPPPAAPSIRLLRRAIRDWTASTVVNRLPDVHGASETELQQLAALGGVAKVLGGSQVANWPPAVAEWALAGPDLPLELLELITAALRSGTDALAEAYNACISRENRRKLGTVFTPILVVEHMLALASKEMRNEPRLIVDPGAGVGAFTLAAARRWPASQIVAIDINPVTLGLLAARLAYEAGQSLAPPMADVTLRHGDYLQQVADLFSPTSPEPVLVLGNPPYTRTQALSADYKRDSLERGKYLTSGHANLAVMFQAATLGHLRQADLSCMILPASMLFTRAARELRSALFNSRRAITVHRWPAEQRAFIGQNVQAAILTIGSDDPLASSPVIHVARTQVQDNQVQEIENWEISRSNREPASWYGPGGAAEPDFASTLLGKFARVRRGLATGANSFFFLTDEVKSRFPDNAVTPAVPSLRNFDGEAMTPAEHRKWGGREQRRWLLTLNNDQQFSKALHDYLETHEEIGVRHLCQQRATWWSITDLPRPEILVSPLSKEGFKIVLNPIGAVPSNNLLGIFVGQAKPEPLADWLKSSDGQARLRLVSRRYHGGSQKIEPGDLRGLQVPAEIAQLYLDEPELQLSWTPLDVPGGSAVP